MVDLTFWKLCYGYIYRRQIVFVANHKFTYHMVGDILRIQLVCRSNCRVTCNLKTSFEAMFVMK